jgi:hypothetical protein
MGEVLVLSIGFVVGIIIAFICLTKLNNDGKSKTKYDERQKAVRGDAYRYAFFATIISCFIVMVLSTIDGLLNIFGKEVYCIPIFIGLLVQISYAIFNDGYVGLNTNMKRFSIFMVFVTIINILVPVRFMIAGEFIKDGVMQTGFMNLLCAGLFIILLIELLIKRLIDKRGE